MLTLKARQVCKCFAGPGPAPHRSDLRALGSPPGVKMPLLTAEFREAALPQERPAFRYHVKLRIIFLFSHVFLEGKVECLSLEEKGVMYTKDCEAFHFRV